MTKKSDNIFVRPRQLCGFLRRALMRTGASARRRRRTNRGPEKTEHFASSSEITAFLLTVIYDALRDDKQGGAGCD